MKNNGFELDFIKITGELGANLGLNRSMGQIYGLLYLSDEPVSLDTIAKSLKMSKGSVSLNVRELEKWEAVKKSWQQGSRKDFYEANIDFVNIIYKRLMTRYKKIIQEFSTTLTALDGSSLTKTQKERLSQIKNFQSVFQEIIENLPEQIFLNKLAKAVSVLNGMKRLISAAH
ncbi:MAG: hypothetical protein ABII74_02235 [Elusimicrobiota bacterium]